ncbi:MAG: hypothetical protein A2491_02995 [Bacteroidetes bacterium RIFOXYC12_FULL_35_7]|nr:MAG: hypothetical protein A2491_02995 [Bacteroidetes bacterium RIFOXYC12_FULL_35_7]
MKIFQIKSLYFFMLLLLNSIICFSQSGMELVTKMLAKEKEINTLKFDMTIKERVNGKLVVSKSSFKIQYTPFKVYLKQEYPMKGMEALYVTGTNNNNVLVNPNSFPWTNLNFDVNSYHMRKDQHHSIYDAGIKYVYSIITHIMDKYKDEIENLISNEGTIVWKNKQCWKITMKNPHFEYIKHKISENENPHKIAEKYKINDYYIIDKNAGINKFEDCKLGMTVKIPNDYATKMDIWLDKETFLPVIMKIYDDLGVYEEYEFINMKVNLKFDTKEFTQDYKDYNF